LLLLSPLLFRFSEDRIISCGLDILVLDIALGFF
jgi:hypothetical protein